MSKDTEQTSYVYDPGPSDRWLGAVTNMALHQDTFESDKHCLYIIDVRILYGPFISR